MEDRGRNTARFFALPSNPRSLLPRAWVASNPEPNDGTIFAMKVYQLYRRQALAMDLDEAWAFFTSPYHLNEVTPDFFNVEIISKVPDKIYGGLMICYKMKAILGIPMTWVSEVSHCNEPKRFVYFQRVGPFRFLTHEVCLTENNDHIVVEDILFYGMPLGWLGQCLNSFVIAKKLQQIFDVRRNYLHKRWGTEPLPR